MNIQLTHRYEDIIAMENLCQAWQEFVVGKRERADVQDFSRSFMENSVALHEELSSRTYRHGPYEDFKICDPKPRHIHKASVRDRLVHHAIYRILYPLFDRTFIADSFSCRNNKGVHKALDRFRVLARQVSRNHTRTCWVLKCDIQKFFASIDHAVLLEILARRIPDTDILGLLNEVIGSFAVESYRHCEQREAIQKGTWIPDPPPRRGEQVRDDSATDPGLGQDDNDDGIGLPLGNLTSQLFANIYLNEFDQWAKHWLKAKYYIRYADDFVFLSHDRQWLESLIPTVRTFLAVTLRLTLHPQKIFLKTFASGVDFLGWVHFSDHRVLRTMTKRHMMRRIQSNPSDAVLQSYLGLLGHGNAMGLKEEIRVKQWLVC